MASLASHTNVWSTALELLERLGYRLTLEGPDPDEGGYAFTAERDGFTFAATNPVELLGLTAIYEDAAPAADEPYWWTAKTVGTGVFARLQDEAHAREKALHAALEALRTQDPAAWEAKVRAAFEHGYDQLNAATLLEVTSEELTRILEDPCLADLRARPKRPGGD